jgi:RNA polymerase sigma-70 factor (ECF subfamily)
LDELAARKSVERARGGDADAFSTLFQSYRSDVHRLCARLLASDSEADDATSEAFLRCHRALDSYDSGQPFRPWLLAIASHHCIDLLRRRSTEQRIFDPRDIDPEQLAIPSPTPLHQRLQAEVRQQIFDGLAALPDRYRAPLVLRYYADLDYDAIGEVLGVTRNQVATLLYRGKQRLRDALASDPATGAELVEFRIPSPGSRR